MENDDKNSKHSNDDMYDKDELLPEDAELVEEEIIYDFNSEGSNEHTLEIIENNDDDDTSCALEITYQIELDIEPEYIGQ
jgi:hypothetical protein